MSTLPSLICCLLFVQHEGTQLDATVLDRLQTVVDGPDTRGEGFAALVAEVMGWSGELSVENEPQIDWILKNPVQARGTLFTLQGVAEQRTLLAAPWNGIEEWFVRDANGSLFCLYVVGESNLVTGLHLKVPARFYKTIEMEGRDKRLRMYPTFVTSSVVIPAIATSSEAPFSFLLLPLIGLGTIVVFLLTRLRKYRKPRGHVLRIETEDVLDAVNEQVGDLPEDSSQALAAMYKQSEGKE